ncbi:hypothetical protein ACRAWF_22715 [Streptomyces sp. L7]
MKPLAERFPRAARAAQSAVDRSGPLRPVRPGAARGWRSSASRRHWRRCPAWARAPGSWTPSARTLDRYVIRGRCPADDPLDRVRGTDSRPHGKDIRT